MSQPLVSIIIPAYNCPVLLRECLDSVTGQSYRHLEIIIVDDGSTDDTPAVIEQYASLDDRIKVITKTNGGQSTARNMALERARGEYISFVDADDMMHRSMIEVLVDFALETDADMVSCHTTSDIDKLYCNTKKSYTISGHEAAIDMLYQHKLLCSPWGKLFKQALFRESRFTPGKYFEDLELIPQVTYQARQVTVIDSTLYYYRQHDGSFIHTFSPKRFDCLDATACLEKWARSTGDKRLVKAVIERRLSASFYSLALADGKPEYRNITNQCRDYIKAHRLRCLLDRSIRFKSRAGIMLSCLGERTFLKINSIIRAR